MVATKQKTISFPAAEKLVSKLATLPGWKDLEPVGRTELAYCLMAAVPDETTGRLVISRLLQGDWVPKPKDFTAAAVAIREEQESEEIPAADGSCPDCRGKGWSSRWVRIEIVRNPDGTRSQSLRYLEGAEIDQERARADGYGVIVSECAGPCFCAYGQALERQRKRKGEKIHTKGTRERDDD